MQQVGIRNRWGRLGFIAALVCALMVASTVLLAVTADTAYAGGREPNVTLTKETKKATKGVARLTVAPSSIYTGQFMETTTIWLGTKDSTPNVIYLKQKPVVKGLKNSNSSVADVTFSEVYPFNGKYMNTINAMFTPKKPGTTTVSFKVKAGKKVKTCKFTVKVHAYDKAVTKVAIGKTNLTSKINKSGSFVQLNKKKISGKFKVKAASGWKLEEATFWTYATAKNGYKQTSKTLKSGKKYTLKNGYVYLKLKNGKDKRIRHLTVSLKYPITTASLQAESKPQPAGSLAAAGFAA